MSPRTIRRLQVTWAAFLVFIAGLCALGSALKASDGQWSWAIDKASLAISFLIIAAFVYIDAQATGRDAQASDASSPPITPANP